MITRAIESNRAKALRVFNMRGATALKTSRGWVRRCDLKRDPQLADVIMREGLLAAAMREDELGSTNAAA